MLIRIRNVVLSALTYSILAIYAIIVAYPMIWLLMASFKSSRELFEKPWALPSTWKLSNFAAAWGEAEISRYFLNSIIVTAVSMVLILLVGAMAAYALARFVFQGRNAIYNMFLSGMMFPMYLGIVPLFLLLKNIGLWNTHPGLILVYVAYSLPFTIFILTGFFKTLPSELAEAGLIDGCSEFGIFWRIMLPLAKPGLVTAGILTFFGVWNEYPLGLVIISDSNLRTLPLGIADLVMQQKYMTNWGALLAGLVIIMIPTLVVYLFFQRQITAGLTAGAIKG